MLSGHSISITNAPPLLWNQSYSARSSIVLRFNVIASKCYTDDVPSNVDETSAA